MKVQRCSQQAESVQARAGSQLLDEMLETSALPQAVAGQASVVIGTVTAVGPELAVTWAGQPEPTRARRTVAIGPSDVGREVTLQFESGDPARPIVTGLLQDGVATDERAVGVEIDGNAMVLEGQEQVVLRCGKASITLTRAGKVLVQGAYVSSRSTGVHRILGGSVEIN